MIYNASCTRHVTLLLLFFCTSCSTNNNHIGKPYFDSLYSDGPQEIPGRLQCEYFDTGGEGIAYHDQDSLNSGSGALNPADAILMNSESMMPLIFHTQNSVNH